MSEQASNPQSVPNGPQAKKEPAAASNNNNNNNNSITKSNNNSNNNNTKKKKEKPAEFNPRWMGYVYISLTSLVNFASISDIPRGDRRSYWAASMAFGLFTFSISVLVLAQDRSQTCLEMFHFSKAREGYFEGYTLIVFVLWWIVGVGYETRADGIAYVANNIYFSSWLALFSCIYTLDKWSASKDILSIAELTGLSATLKSWYVLFLTSLLVLGTCIDLHVRVDRISDRDDSSFGIGLGAVSTIVAFFFIIVHYDFIPNCEEGGWLELSSSFFLIGLHIIGLAILTQDQGIAATLSGSQCARSLDQIYSVNNCSIHVSELDENGEYVETVIECTELPRQVPGSNLYFATWACFAASFNITLRWKAAQALNLAQAQEEKERLQLEGGDGEANDDFSDHSDDGAF